MHPTDIQARPNQCPQLSGVENINYKAGVGDQMHPNPVYKDHASQAPFANGVKPISSIQAGLGNMHPTDIQARPNQCPQLSGVENINYKAGVGDQMHPNPVYSEHPGQNAFVQRSATRIQAGVGNMHPTNIQAGTLRHHENAFNIQAGNSFAPQHGRTPNQEQHPIDHHQAGVGNMHLTSCQARQDKQCNQPGDESPRDASESTKVCHPSPVPSCSPGVPNLRTEKCTLAKPKPSCRPDVLTSHDLDLRKQTQQCIPQHDSAQQLGGEDTEAEHDHAKPKIMPRTTTC